MAFEEALHCVSIPANADLSSYQYSGINVNSSGYAVIATDGAEIDGVLQNKPSAQGQPASVGVGGITKVVAGGTCTAGTYGAVADSSGRFANAASGDPMVVKFLETTSTTGAIIAALLVKAGRAL